MKYRSFFSWMQKLSMLVAIIFATTFAVQAQPNYMTIFGDPLVAPCGTDYYHRLNCTATPTISGSTLSTIDSIQDGNLIGFGGVAGANHMLYNSQYDANGDLLFLVDARVFLATAGTL